jgi:hypothetical protein
MKFFKKKTKKPSLWINVPLEYKSQDEALEAIFKTTELLEEKILFNFKSF